MLEDSLQGTTVAGGFYGKLTDLGGWGNRRVLFLPGCSLNKSEISNCKNGVLLGRGVSRVIFKKCVWRERYVESQKSRLEGYEGKDDLLLYFVSNLFIAD